MELCYNELLLLIVTNENIKNEVTILNKKKLYNLTLIGLMSAILCILAPFSIAVPGTLVPISMGTFAVYLTSSVLGWKKGTLSVLIYLLLGMMGVPVFAGWTAGVQKLAGPTGGYLIGYLFIALLTGFFAERFSKKMTAYPIGMVLGTIICYFFGTLWLSIQNSIGILETLSIAVIPFLPGDLLKIIGVTIIAFPVKKALKALLPDEILT